MSNHVSCIIGGKLYYDFKPDLVDPLLLLTEPNLIYATKQSGVDEAP